MNTMSGGATVGYGEVFLEVPDLSFPLLDICEAFFGRAAAEALLKRGQAALRSSSTQQIVVTLPFECLPTLDDAYELVADWSGLEEFAPSSSSPAAEEEQEGTLVREEDADVVGMEEAARRERDTAAGSHPDIMNHLSVVEGDVGNANGTVGGGIAKPTSHDDTLATTNASFSKSRGGAEAREQYEVALLNALEHMGVGDLFTLAVQQRAERRKREARGEGQQASLGKGRKHSSRGEDASIVTMDREGDETLSLLSLDANPSSSPYSALSASHTAAASPASAVALGLPVAGTSLDKFGALAYRTGVYNPFLSLTSAMSSSEISVDDKSRKAEVAGGASSTTTSKRLLVPASTLASAAAMVGDADEGDLDDVYRYNDGVVKRWRTDSSTLSTASSSSSEGHVRVMYVPHHSAYTPESHHIRLGQSVVAMEE